MRHSALDADNLRGYPLMHAIAEGHAEIVVKGLNEIVRGWVN